MASLDPTVRVTSTHWKWNRLQLCSPAAGVRTTTLTDDLANTYMLTHLYTAAARETHTQVILGRWGGGVRIAYCSRTFLTALLKGSHQLELTLILGHWYILKSYYMHWLCHYIRSRHLFSRTSDGPLKLTSLCPVTRPITLHALYGIRQVVCDAIM